MITRKEKMEKYENYHMKMSKVVMVERVKVRNLFERAHQKTHPS